MRDCVSLPHHQCIIISTFQVKKTQLGQFVHFGIRTGDSGYCYMWSIWKRLGLRGSRRLLLLLLLLIILCILRRLLWLLLLRGRCLHGHWHRWWRSIADNLGRVLFKFCKDNCQHIGETGLRRPSLMRQFWVHNSTVLIEHWMIGAACKQHHHGRNIGERLRQGSTAIDG